MGQIPYREVKKLIWKMSDGHDYYVLDSAVEAASGSASREYVIVVEGEWYLFLGHFQGSSNLFRHPVTIIISAKYT